MKKGLITLGLGGVAIGMALGVLGSVVFYSLTSASKSNKSDQSVELGRNGPGLVSELTNNEIATQKSEFDSTSRFDSPDETKSELKSTNPSQVWNSLVKDDKENIAQVDAFLKVGADWANLEGLKVIDTVRDTLGSSAVADAVVLSILYDAFESDSQTAFQSALSLSPQSRKDALASIVSMWAKTDPIATLAALNSTNLGAMRGELHQSLIDSWIESNPKDLLANLEHLPDYLKRNAQHGAMLGVARTTPPDAIEFLAELPNDPNDDRRYDLAFEIAEHWSRINAYAALEWVSSIPFPGEGNKRPQRMLLTKVLRNLAASDPNLALQSALNDPMGRFDHGLEPYVVSKVAQIDAEKAISMLSNVRDGKTKTASYRSVGRALSENGRYERAVDLGLSLSEENQSNYYCAVFNVWARSDPGHLLKSLEEMPTSLVKSQAAYNLLASHRRSGLLNDREIENLQGIVDGSGHKVTLAATSSYTDSSLDYDALLLQLELESNLNDGEDTVFVLSGN
ncbi:MAG: hypothetical protein F4X44_05585 [Gammaproteobacteria bacterium]|nr:hypothetical protein [Gammaproteobacteria bacterium]MYD80063.1 hypothetical protein [Gammaproteobacteria bacterium]